MKNSQWAMAEQGIRDIAQENFNGYPEDYPIENGKATQEAVENTQDLAVNYWENRTDLDEQRDSEQGITKADYSEWVMEAFEDWVADKNNS